MSSDYKVKLTGPAEERLSSFLESYRKEILEVLRREKFVPGEDITEASAADVDTAIRHVRQGKTRRVEISRLYSQMILAIGGLLILAGITYPTLTGIKQIQIVLIGAGMYLGLAGLVFYRLLALRYPRQADGSPDMSERLSNLERMVSELKKGQTSPTSLSNRNLPASRSAQEGD
jgi:hypothetical protein